MNLVKSFHLNKKVSFLACCKINYDYSNLSEEVGFTSKPEEFANDLIDTTYFQLPYISTYYPSGLSEISNDDSSDFLIFVDEQNTLENRLVTLMSSENIRKNLGGNSLICAKAYLAENFIKTGLINTKTINIIS